MIAFVVGTTAELIKIAPVFRAVEKSGGSCEVWFTGYHVHGIPEMLRRLGLPEPARWLGRGVAGRNLERPRDVPRWFVDVLRASLRGHLAMRRDLVSDGRSPLVVVHGDTFTTVLGSVLGRTLGVPVAHVEAGLRSGSLRSPFPEEINRRVAGRLVRLHFAPTPREVANLRDHRGHVVLTGANTIVDSLALLRSEQPPGDMPDRYGVATLHRFELLQDPAAFAAALEVLREGGERTPIFFYAGAPEQERLERFGLRRLFDGHRLVLRDKVPYPDFLPVLAGAAFVVTDSGGLQEECAYLGLPCAVHRERTERHQGLGENVVLSGMDLGIIRHFLQDPEVLRRQSTLGVHRPTERIVDALRAAGHL